MFLVVRITFQPGTYSRYRCRNRAKEFPPIYCDNNSDGKENIDLTQLQPKFIQIMSWWSFLILKSYNALNGTLQTLIQNPLNTEVQNGEILYVKVKFKDSDCFFCCKVTVSLPVINDVINLNKKRF